MRSALALVLTALLVACGGSSEQRTPSEVHFDLQRAEALAGLALLQAAEIQGEGWTLQPPSDLENTPACAGLYSFYRSIKQNARAQGSRAFQKPSGPGAFPLQVTQHVYLLETPEQALAIVEDFRKLPDFSECISSGVAGVSQARTVTGEVDASSSASSLSAVRAFETTRGNNERIRSVFVVWQEGNAVGWVNINGPSGNVNGPLTTGIVSKAAAVLRETGEGKRVPTAAASPAPA